MPRPAEEADDSHPLGSRETTPELGKDRVAEQLSADLEYPTLAGAVAGVDFTVITVPRTRAGS